MRSAIFKDSPLDARQRMAQLKSSGQAGKQFPQRFEIVGFFCESRRLRAARRRGAAVEKAARARKFICGLGDLRSKLWSGAPEIC